MGTYTDSARRGGGADVALPRARLVCLNPDRLTGHPAKLVANVAEGRIHDLGSDRRCDVVLNAPEVAPRHARLVPSPEQWRIAAVDGAPVSINGRQVVACDLNLGDRVTIGPLAFRFEELPGGSPAPEADLTADPRRASRRMPASVLWSGVLAVLAAIGIAAGWQFTGEPGSDRVLAPTAAYRQILDGASADIRVLRYEGNDAILVLDFPTLADQGRMLNRIAALVEKAGAPRDRVLTDAELADYIVASGTSIATFYYGHDYRAVDLARFFTLARNSGIALNEDEGRLLRILVEQGTLVEVDNGFRAADVPRAVISIPQIQPDDETTTAHWEGIDRGLRNAILRHELSHGEYFTNAAYREHCARFWKEALTPVERTAVTAYLERLGYDPGNEDLMINEMQAFLIHTPDPRIFGAADVGMSESRLATLRVAFRAENPPTSLLGETLEQAVAE